MNILLYRNNPVEQPEGLEHLMTAWSGVANCQLVRQREELLAKLRSPEAAIAIVVLQIDSRDELIEFVAMRETFGRRQLVVILPDAGFETVSWCHRLHPRYLMLPGNPWEWLEAVILQMVRESAPPQRSVAYGRTQNGQA